MTARAVAFWIIVALTVIAVAGLSLAVVSRMTRRESSSAEVAALGVGMTFAFWAGIGWAWWLSGGTVQ